jgi:DNA-binding NarL/FixJ family response regulator
MAMMMAEKFVKGLPGMAKPLFEKLSDRELEVFHLLGRGYSAGQNAEELLISFWTVQAFCA